LLNLVSFVAGKVNGYTSESTTLDKKEAAIV